MGISKFSRMSNDNRTEDCKQTLYFEFAANEDLRLVYNNDPVDADLESKALAFGERGSLYTDANAKKAAEQQEAEETKKAVAEVEARLIEEREHWASMSNLASE